MTRDAEHANATNDIIQALQPNGPYDRMLNELLKEFSAISIDVRELNQLMATHETRLTDLADQINHLQALVTNLK